MSPTGTWNLLLVTDFRSKFDQTVQWVQTDSCVSRKINSVCMFHPLMHYGTAQNLDVCHPISRFPRGVSLGSTQDNGLPLHWHSDVVVVSQCCGHMLSPVQQKAAPPSKTPYVTHLDPSTSEPVPSPAATSESIWRHRQHILNIYLGCFFPYFPLFFILYKVAASSSCHWRRCREVVFDAEG